MITTRCLFAFLAVTLSGCNDVQLVAPTSTLQKTSATPLPPKIDEQNHHMKASPTSGTAPLTVDFEAVGDGRSHFGGVWLMFGDGESAMACRPGSACREISITHVYKKSGEFHAVLKSQGEGQDHVMGQVTIKVTAN